MRLRTRLFLLVGAVVAVTVALVTWAVSLSARRSFAALDEQRTAALVAEFRREFASEAEEAARRVDRIAASDQFRRIALAAGAAGADYTRYVNDAAPLASAHGLDFLDVVAEDGTIISSAHWPARFGYRHTCAARERENTSTPARAFLQAVDGPEGSAIGLVASRRIRTGGRDVYVAGGRRLDQRFLESLELPAGMRTLLIDLSRRTEQARELQPLVARVRESKQEAREQIDGPQGPETMHAIPLLDDSRRVVGVLLVGSSGREVAALVERIRWTGVGLGALGIALGCALSYGVASRITGPVEQLAESARAVARGEWDVRADVQASGEVAELAATFDTMTRQLVDQRERLMQAERVAAWRELARRLAHELKNPLFPLRLTLDNLRRARTDHPREFNEVFEESMATLSTGLGNLNAVIARFSDFARMPAPTFEQVSLNDVVQQAAQLFQAQLETPERPRIALTLDLDTRLDPIRADPEQLGRAVQNLVLNAIDAMPAGGTLTLRTRAVAGAARLEVADTGEGLTEEERKRLFTPYYTTKQHGTGLGLAIVQSTVADHGGKIRVESVRGRGTTFHIELPS